MKTKKELKEVLKILKETYPEAKCSLDFNSPFQITIAVLLAAQCTDERVNIVTKKLFKDCPDVYSMAKLSVDDIVGYIKSINFFSNKAKFIHALCKKVVNEYNGEIPQDMEKLQTLPGIGRKSANVVMLEGFNNPQGIAVDTHAKRICNRLGILSSDDVVKIEKELLRKLDKDDYYDANHLLVYHGRAICDARKPKCEICPVKKYCKYKLKNI